MIVSMADTDRQDSGAPAALAGVECARADELLVGVAVVSVVKPVVAIGSSALCCTWLSARLPAARIVRPTVVGPHSLML